MTACVIVQDPQQALRQQAAGKFEKLDATYLDAARAALRQADPVVPTAYELALYALATANFDFMKGLKQITMPDDSKTDAEALSDAALQLEEGALACQSLIASGSVCQASVLTTEIQMRNSADRQLRKDLHLDQSEVPA